MPRVSALPALPVVLAALALGLLTGCADELGPGPAGPATALTLPGRSPATSTATSTAPAPTGGDDVAACYDGDCEVRVTDGTEIRVDPRFGVEKITVTVRDGRGRITIDTGGGYVSSGGVGGTSIYNDLSVKLVAVDGGTATVRLSAS